MTGGPAIIRAGPAHAATIAAIHAGSFPDKQAWGTNAISLLLGLPSSFAFLHPDGGMVIGRAAAGEAEVLSLAVAPEVRCRGIGGALLAAAMEEAARRRASAIFLEVSATNSRVLDLYARAGFAAVGRRSRYYANGSDALVMRASLILPSATAIR
ncbi:MAG: GNAT family N-acetyltransferase [Acetobacteraceae bacterium]|nr:GNAT family N-acetyltransferase [Acetobacteraceae bacterium]